MGGPLPSRAANETTAARLPPALSPPTLSRDDSPRRIDTELFCILCDPFGRSDGVVDGGGEFVFGREAIVDGNHDHLGFVGEFPAHHIVEIEIPDPPAAAVKKHQARRKPACQSQ